MHLYLAGKMDDIGKPAWIALMILGFIIWWPVGLAILAYLIWSGRMGCRQGFSGSHMREKWGRYCRSGSHRERRAGWGGGSGNSAFEEYKAETLRRLEEEQNEFMDFLSRLRHAKDKAEFDQFMEERRRRAETPPENPASGEQPSS